VPFVDKGADDEENEDHEGAGNEETDDEEYQEDEGAGVDEGDEAEGPFQNKDGDDDGDPDDVNPHDHDDKGDEVADDHDYDVMEENPEADGNVDDANEHDVAEDEHGENEGAVETVSEGEEEPDEGSHGYNLRPHRACAYDHRLDHQMDEPARTKSYVRENIQLLQTAVEHLGRDPSDVHRYICGFMMTQMTAKAGIKKHGQVAVDALVNEFAQLDDKNVFEPLHGDSLTWEEKKAALDAISVIKEKRCGKIKGRTVANGSKQRNLYTKEETTSPTISTDALMLSLMIDAAEGRDVATADVEGAYLHADMDDFVVMRITGESVDIMCNVNPRYAPFVTVEKGKWVLYM